MNCQVFQQKDVAIPLVLQKLSEAAPTRHLLCPHLSVFHHRDIPVPIRNTFLLLDYWWQQAKPFTARRSCLFAETVRTLLCQYRKYMCTTLTGIPLLRYLVTSRAPCPPCPASGFLQSKSTRLSSCFQLSVMFIIVCQQLGSAGVTSFGE